MDEIIPVLDDLVQSFSHPPILVYTGGDPLERDDLDEMVTQAVNRGLVTAIAPSVTPKLTDEVVKHWQALGVHSVSLSLDGANADLHDRFRGVRGTFERTLEVAADVVGSGMKLQVNTSISQQTLESLPLMASLVQFLGVSSWELFFVIPTGRARIMDALDSTQIEGVLEWLSDFAPTQPYRITTVGAPQWARVRHRKTPSENVRQVAREARGFAFIDHRGDVFPSGYLPVSAGNVRNQSFSSVYRDSALFGVLRDASQFHGACGVCPYKDACGGSRARAYAVTQDLLASDPGCAYAPEGSARAHTAG